jgi:hypothetical protein
MINMKKCNKCLETKELSDFYISKGKVKTPCRKCSSLRYLEKNPSRKRRTILTEEQRKEKARLYAKRNKDKLKEYRKNYNINNFERVSQSKKEYKRNNKAKISAINSSRRLKKTKATFKYLLPEIENVYKYAEDMKIKGIEVQVDHIIPINHPNVCGLHVPWNPQILSKYENLIKSNKFDGTYHNEGWKLDL